MKFNNFLSGFRNFLLPIQSLLISYSLLLIPHAAIVLKQPIAMALMADKINGKQIQIILPFLLKTNENDMCFLLEIPFFNIVFLWKAHNFKKGGKKMSML